MKGKNFSCNNVQLKRRKSDFYETPYSITAHLLANESFYNFCSVLEPACGNGAMVKVLAKHWDKSRITSYDKEVDFFKENRCFDYVITNPPFSLAHEFIIKAKTVALKKFAFLLPLSYLHGKRRFDEIYTQREYGLKVVHVFTRYPMLGEELRADGKYNTGMMVYAWFVFENGYSRDPIISWIDNNKDVLTKSDKVTHE